MKKFLVLGVLFMILLTGCDKTLLNTPTKKTEMFFAKYQSLDSDVLEQLNDVTTNKMNFTDKQKEDYIEIMKKHYESLKYDVKDEVINGDIATVTVEIDVMDYSKILADADNYLKEHKEEFNDENGEYSEELFNEYRIEKLKDVKDRVKYTIDIDLSKIEDEWVIDDLDSETMDKIEGVYSY